MSVELTINQQKIVDQVRDCARSILTDSTLLGDAHSEFQMARRLKYCASGILGISMPREFGGESETLLTAALAVRALARHCADEGLIFSLCAQLTTCMVPLLLFGTESQKRRFLPRLITGQLIGGNGTTEPNAGSDLSEMSTTVEQAGGGYELNGVKNFVTNGSIADLLVIYARHPRGMKFADTSALIVERDTPGFLVRRDWKTMGLCSSPLSEIEFDRCRVPAENLIGRQGLAMAIFNESMLWERIIMSAYLLGSMELQFNLALRHCRDRKQFGQSIIQYQGISYRLIDMHRAIETCSALLLQTCLKHERGTVTAADASLLKLHASEGKVANSVQAVSLFGAYGYTKESPVESQLRNSMAAPIYSGTNDVQKRIIANAFQEYT